MTRKIEVAARFNQFALGKPDEALKNKQSAIMGVVYGYATAIAARNVEDPDTGVKRARKYLRGVFRAVPADENEAITHSGLLNLPTALIGDLIAQIEKAGDDASVSPIRTIAYELSVHRIGDDSYEWRKRELLADESDLMADLSAKIAPQPAVAPQVVSGAAVESQVVSGATVEPKVVSGAAGARRR